MDTPSLFRRRFSCRQFAAVPVTEQQLEAILDAARWAPSAGNLQPWRLIVVSTPEVKQALSAAAYGQGLLTEAPVVIAVCAVPEESAARYRQRGRELYCLQDTAAVVENILLAATELGLGACWVGAFDEAAVARALAVPASWRPIALVPLGHPGEAPPNDRQRRPTQEIVQRR